MDKHSKYVTDVQSRSKLRFLLGALARLKRYYINKYAVYIAKKNGATIGEMVTMPLSLAKVRKNILN